MALSNRDRIGQMFELLSPALDDFIQRTVGPDLTDGTDWTSLVAARDAMKGTAGKQYSRGDPQVQLRMLTQNIASQVKPRWYPFSSLLSKTHMSFASELLGIRNDWAHNAPFSNDDAYRALDTAERLLMAVGAGEPGDRIQKLRLDLRRVTADKDDKKAVKAAAVNALSTGLRPWREVLQPHHDVATGNFQAAEFAADLYKVATGDADQSSDYRDPIEFFGRTYLTEGLRDLIGRTIRRLGGDLNASPVINLQTNFGGGKTHSMLALWHLAAGVPLIDFPQDVQELLQDNGYQSLPADVQRVAIVGNHFAASGEEKPDGTRINTIWGELAWQLGGLDAYELVRRSDESATTPGVALHDLLELFSPAVILIDEWVAYARQLYGRDDRAGGTFDTQFTFAQSLTEAAKATRGVLLAISIPASHNPSEQDNGDGSAEEIGGAYGAEALSRLQNVVRRVADQWSPARAEESYRIVRQRLFVEPKGADLALIAATAREFGDMYRKYSVDFPHDSFDKSYEDRIKICYPIHPELFDRLYEDWSTLDRFQRTRGVLRLMNSVIHALWAAGDQSPLILPGSIPLGVASVNSELTQYLSDSWKPIIDTDVDGPRSTPAQIDHANPVFGQRSVTKRLARTVFFGAAPTIGSAHTGLETQRVFLGTAVPGDVPGNFHSALTQLGDAATYFYSGNGRYWYDVQANITRTAKDRAERLHIQDVWAEIIDRLQIQRKQPGDFPAVQIAPNSSADIPDQDEARLIIVHPEYSCSRKKNGDSTAMKFAHAATADRSGQGNRLHRNTVVFLAADQDRLGELSEAVRQYLAWKQIIAQKNVLNLNPQQVGQAVDKRDRLERVVNDRLLGAYHWILTPEQPVPDQPFTIVATKAEGSAGSLADRVSKRLRNESRLDVERAPQLIRHDLENHLSNIWKTGHITVGELWSYYTDYPYMPRLRNRDVLDIAIRRFSSVLGWQKDGFAIANGLTDGAYTGLVLPTDDTAVAVSDSTLLVRPDLAKAQREHLDRVPVVPVPTHPISPVPDRKDTGDPTEKQKLPSETLAPVYTRFFGTKLLDADRYASDFSKIINEVIQHLTGQEGTRLKVRVEITAINPTGYDENKQRTVSENANTLRFEESGFEPT